MNRKIHQSLAVTVIVISLFIISCQPGKKADDQSKTDSVKVDSVKKGPISISEPLVTHIYTADPSAHIFEERIYVYPSHDIDANVPEDDEGGHFVMKDYHVLSMDSIGGEVADHGVAIDLKDIPWAGKQLWAPDAASNSGMYYLYFPAKDKDGIFRIGVATSKSPAGPFKAEPKPIAGSFSMDPAVFKDSDGKYFMYFGGLWGGQLQRWASGKYDPNAKQEGENPDAPALTAKVARLNKNMLQFDESPKDLIILDENAKPLLTKDHDRRFFEASWMHKYNDTYYFSYSTGDTHFIAYATGKSPYGPFTYRGVILNPVIGWTNHHSIIEIKGKWYLFYHDSMLSGGRTHLRSVKVTELKYRPDGTIETIEPYVK